MLKFLTNKHVAFTTLMILWIGSLILVFRYFNSIMADANILVDEVEYIDSVNTYHKLYYEKEFETLRNENKELYDSLKKYKDKVTYLLQFEYEKEYETGKVETSKPTSTSTPKTFEYFAEPNDTFEYKLLINADKEPYWYSLSTRFKEKFTIVNKSDENTDLNHITIESEGKGDISDVTIFKKKEKRKFVDRIGLGPAVTAGYDPINRNFGVVVGMSITYDLKK